MPRHLTVSLLAAIALATAVPVLADDLPARVTFPSADGQTTLVGYLFTPPAGGRHAAIVMMHGRAGAYSSLARGVYDASTLSRRHDGWGRFWARSGYVALIVDGFGPRGYAQGFPRFSYGERPDAVNEVTVRPLDAYGALSYLAARPDVQADRIGLQGWSNGGSATIATLAEGAKPGGGPGFRAALSFYPACGLHNAFDNGYRPYAPILIFMGTADEEVSPRRCRDFVDANRDIRLTMRLYRGATHGFDDPGVRRQRVPANAEATEQAMEESVRFFERWLNPNRN